MYQLMTTVSVLVDDVDAGVEQLVRALGVPAPRPQAYRGGASLRAVFLRVHVKYAVAPTFLELIAPGTADEPGGIPIAAIRARHGRRSIKWHATELAMPEPELHDLADHLGRLGVPLAFFPPDRRDRFFVGGDPGSAEYDAGADAGLLIEAGRSGHLGLPEEAFTAPADVPADASPDTMVRIVAREYLVADLDAALAALARNLRWAPAAVSDEPGCRRAVLPFSTPRSARLELVQPVGAGPAAAAFDELGPGAWTVRVSVVDIAAKAADLDRRGTPYARGDAWLRPDPATTLGVPFEFVAAVR
ncbi:MAG TPA: hypothetical protein VFA83_08185 [Acidimicrobiales bacterium]|nr:hypothetical protein [Acidimicrobiales bacterium]